MINLPSKQELKELKAFNQPFCLTVYAPFIDSTTATNPNRIELKNLLREAETALLSAGVKPQSVKKTLRPARTLLENHEFWPSHHASLALFMHPKMFRYYHISDHGTPYLLTVEKGFNLEPLEKAMQDNKPYFVLALGHKDVRLYEGDRDRLKPVNLKDFPSDMKLTLNIDEYPNWRETHTIAPAGSGKGSEAYHGQYNVSQTDKDMLLQFFRRIDKRLHAFLQGKQAPLILAGVGYLLPIYRQANTYPNLLPGSITGNIGRLKADGIREKAWHVVNSGRLS